jgi:hypothetical protein
MQSIAYLQITFIFVHDLKKQNHHFPDKTGLKLLIYLEALKYKFNQ